MLPKAHLTSHSRMSGSRWVIMPSCLFRSWSSIFTVLLCILATISSYLLLLLGPYHFCPLLSPFFAWNVPLVSLIFWKNLSHSVVFLYFFVLITEEGFLISPWYSLELCIQMGLSFFSPLPFAFIFFLAICKASSDSLFFIFTFLFLGDGFDHCLLYNVTNLHP